MLKNTNFVVFCGRRIFLLHVFFPRIDFLRLVEHFFKVISKLIRNSQTKRNDQLEDSRVQPPGYHYQLCVGRNEGDMQPLNITSGNEIIGYSKSRCSRVRFEELSRNRPEPNYRNFVNLGSQLFRESKII